MDNDYFENEEYIYDEEFRREYMGDDYDGLDDKLLDNDDDSPHYLEENELNQSNEQSTQAELLPLWNFVHKFVQH